MKFWDTSAILALVLEERHSASAQEASATARDSYAWSWLRVEAHAGLARRKAGPEQWETLLAVLDAIRYVDIDASQLDSLCRANREWQLRASDAGHLFCFQQASFVLPDLELVCFDEEIAAAATKAGLHLWKPSSSGSGRPREVREKRAAYGRKR